MTTLKRLHKPEEGMAAKTRCHVRFSHLLPFEELTMNVIPRLEHVGKLVSFSGEERGKGGWGWRDGREGGKCFL